MVRVKDRILDLRAKGYTYDQIVEEIGCSKGTVAYHCGEGQKEKTKERTRKIRSEKPILRKIDNFKRTPETPGWRIIEDYIKAPSSMLKDKLRKFSSKGESNAQKENCSFTYEEFIEEFGNTKECYLTGRAIDFDDPSSYSFDHIVPASKGGTNTLSNLGVSCREANFAKSDMDLEEFITLCLEVVIHFGVVEVIE